MLRMVLVTGANGFIGSALCRRLVDEKWTVFGSVRNANRALSVRGAQPVSVGDANAATDWRSALRGVEVVVHLAARVHVIKDDSPKALDAYREVNVKGTETLARQAADDGVKRFVFMSSVKVNGEENQKAYTEYDNPSPLDAYGISKMEAEQKLQAIAGETGLEVVILRPPLVYGPGVKANFLKLLQLVNRGVYLPLASVKNRRSLVYVENLVDAVCECLRHPAAAGQTFFVSDGQDVSTPALIRMIAGALQKKPRLFRFPPLALYLAGRLMGRGPAVDRLIGSLAVDTSRIKTELGWEAPIEMKEGLRRTADWFNSSEVAT